MTPNNKKPPAAKGMPQQSKQATARPHQFKPVVAQPKAGPPAQSVKRPIAPPVYRPQAKPNGVQTKLAGPQHRPQPAQKVLQMRKPPGFYKLNKTANLRARNHAVIRQIAEGQTVYAKNNALQSNFKAGTHWYSTTNEHTWVEWDDPSDPENEYLEAEGWIEDSKLDAAPRILQQEFQPGDKIYGRRETRRAILHSGKARNQGVRRTPLNIIDDVNDTIIGRQVTDRSPKEVHDFARFATDRMGVEASEVRIRKMCKLGLAFTTTQATKVIHFMLDGLDANQVVLEAVHTRNNEEARAMGTRRPHDTEKHCTGAEMRALMRQRLHDTGARGGKNSGIDLTRVKFYMSYAEIPAPWARDAPPAWHRAWTDYSRYRAQVSEQKGRIGEARSKGKGKDHESIDDDSF